MDVAAISTMITTFGFPVVACGAMGWFVKYITDKNREEISNLNIQHHDEMNNLKDSLNNNTLVMQQLLDYLKGSDENEIDQ